MISEDSYKHLLSTMASITWSLNSKEEMIPNQKSWEEFTGQSEAEYSLNGWKAALHPHDVEIIESGLNELRDFENDIFESQLRIFNRIFGRYHQVLVKIIPICDKDHNIEQWFCACFDIQELKDKEQQLRFNEERYRRLSDVTEESICISKGFRIVEVNRAMCKLFGYTEEELYGKNVLDLSYNEASTRSVYKHLNQGIEVPYEGIGRKKDGSTFHAYISGKNIEEDGDTYRVSIIRDITKEKIYRDKILESEQRFRQLVEQAPFAIEIYDKEGYLKDANKEFEQVWKLNSNDLVGVYNILKSQHFKELGILLYIKKAFKGEVQETPEFEYNPRKDGLESDVTRWFKARLYPIFTGSMEVDNIVIMYEDISGQKETETEILNSFIKGEDKERQRIATDIHDGLAQYLTAANLNLNSVKEDTKLDEAKMMRFDLGLKFLQQAIEESRSIAQNLMPKAIKDFGLLPSLEFLIKNINNSWNTEVSFYHNVQSDTVIEQQITMNIYRITQEALNNALKYAEASKIIVQLINHENELIFTVEDDGKGFYISKLGQGNQGLGLRSIDNRVKSMGAKLEINSAPNRGTLIAITIPTNKK